MRKNKLLLLTVLAAPMLAFTSCNKTGSVTITLDTGIGYFTNGDCYRTLTINKGRTLKNILENDAPISDTSFAASKEFFANPVRWVDDNEITFDIESSINEDLTLHARFFLSLSEARNFGLQKIGSQYMDASARQPEAIKKLSTAYQAAAEHINKAPTEGSAVAMGKIGGSEMDGCARQPEAIEKIMNNAEYYYLALETDTSISNINAMGLGKIGLSAMDALARQPEAYLKFEEASKSFVDEIKKLPIYSGYGFGEFGSSFMDGCARQPEAITSLLEKTAKIFEGFENATSNLQSFAIGNVASSWADACARQPEAIKDLSTELYRNIDYILKNK